ncbi:GDSL esterase/lipase At5g14450-like [Hibiscus syriacus]|uniref:GDSL esterase/lipase At5g14450-like n=1 Tax=Hibiscus syriacus TaxID=106335 RepID=UPI001923DF72|nr:GDSL esterase/lipase At5g14450-like [Hibiscus syriacus]
MEEQWKVVYLLGILVLVFAQQWKQVESNAQGSVSCGFPAMYNFGDSNSDTGGISAALNEILQPNGETFFGHPAGRASDGRLVLRVKLPYLGAYLDSIGTNFRHGANFATGGSSVRPPGFSQFNLGIQISQFIQFKARTTTLYNQLNLNRRIALSISNIPRPAEFSQALYTYDIGQNDLGHGFQTMSEKQVLDSISHIIGELAKSIHQLYKEGTRFFWIHNTGPLGCLPYNVIYGKKAGNLHKNGCVKSQNEAAMEFNSQLKDEISWLRTQFPFAKFTYVDVYSAKYAFISNAKNLGKTSLFLINTCLKVFVMLVVLVWVWTGVSDMNMLCCFDSSSPLKLSVWNDVSFRILRDKNVNLDKFPDVLSMCYEE